MSRAMMLRSGRGGAGGSGSNGHAVDADITDTAREISGRSERKLMSWRQRKILEMMAMGEGRGDGAL